MRQRLLTPAKMSANTRFDLVLAAVATAACEAESIVQSREHPRTTWPLAGVILAAAVLTLPLVWRRRAVLASALATMLGVVLLEAALSGPRALNTIQFVLFIPPYSLGAYLPRDRSLVGLGACLVTVSIAGPSPLSTWLFAIGAVLASWAAGRVMQGHRRVASDLKKTAQRINEERDALEVLAVAEQRTQIAAELQEVVAESLSEMIVLARTAKDLVGTDVDAAERAMDRIEGAGRAALDEMRRILGVLRRVGARPALAPAPGIGQIVDLVENARQQGRTITLQVHGDPRSVPATVDLTVYRILDDALTTSSDVAGGTAVALDFYTEGLGLSITLEGGCLAWPTPAIIELATMTSAQIDISPVTGGGECLSVQMPTSMAATA